MTITASLFEAFIKCPTKCYLRSLGNTGAENAYANWVRDQSESYHTEGIKHLIKGIAPDDFALGLTCTETLATAKWRLAVGLVASVRIPLIPDTHSEAKRPFVPGDSGRLFRSIPDTPWGWSDAGDVRFFA